MGSEVGNEDLGEYGKKGSNFSNIYLLSYLLNSLQFKPFECTYLQEHAQFFKSTLFQEMQRTPRYPEAPGKYC